MSFDDIIARFERDIEMPPGTKVLYQGRIEKCHGVWVVSSHIDDTRVTLASVTNEWERLNASKSDLTVVE